MTTGVGGAAWLDAVVAGDTATWRRHRAAHPGAVGDRTGSAGASQLELVRRLLIAHVDLPDPATLADLVIATAPAGRGPVDLPLPSSTAPAPTWGTPPVEPDQLAAGELLRVAVPVLLRLLPPAPPAQPPARTPLLARRFVVHGAPGAAAAVAAVLTGAGWVHGAFRAVHLVLGCPPDAGVEQLWSRRVGAGSARGWRRTWRTLHARNALPHPLDTAALADRVAAGIPSRHRERRMLVAVGVDGPAAAATALAALGVDVHGADPATDPAPDPATVDLHRRLNVLTAADAPRDTGLLDRIAPQHGVRLGVPAAQRAWATGQADRLAVALEDGRRHADYPVLGDPGALATLRGAEVATRVDPADTLERALAAIGAAWRTATGTEG